MLAMCFSNYACCLNIDCCVSREMILSLANSVFTQLSHTQCNHDNQDINTSCCIIIALGKRATSVIET